MLSEFMVFLINCVGAESGRIPALAQLSKDIGISISGLREQLEVARQLGFVEVRPRTGIRKTEYSFQPAVKLSTAYGISNNPQLFKKFTELRNHIEVAYWDEAVHLLDQEDHQELKKLVYSAWQKLRKFPDQQPDSEHRDLHLRIFHKLDNLFVTGILEAYWELYAVFGFNVVSDLDYLNTVWQYHERIIDSIINQDYGLGHQLLLEHMDLLNLRSNPSFRQTFE